MDRPRYPSSQLALAARTLPASIRPSFSPPATAEKILELELVLGTSLPEPIHDFFTQHDSISAMDVWNGYFVGGIDVILRSLKRGDFPRVVESRPVIAIATDGGGNAFLTPSDSDGPVWKWLHETGAVTEVARDFNAFSDRLADDFRMFADGNDRWQYMSG
jgi:hypothetical protein